MKLGVIKKLKISCIAILIILFISCNNTNKVYYPNGNIKETSRKYSDGTVVLKFYDSLEYLTKKVIYKNAFT